MTEGEESSSSAVPVKVHDGPSAPTASAAAAAPQAAMDGGDGGGGQGKERRDRSDSLISLVDDDGPEAEAAAPSHHADATTTMSSPERRMTEARRNSTLSKTAARNPFYKIVLTGGPCGGKTTSLARLSSYLRERGFEVITSPEAFSILISNGMSMEYFGVEGMDAVVQHTVMDLQMSLEDGFERLLRARGKPAVLLCDRGLMDGAAYMSPQDWDDFLRERNVESSCELREGRYNAVFHMVTAAEGAERFYTLENNEVRTETPEEARRLDKLTRGAWVGHPHLKVFDNSTDFEGKLRRLVECTAKLVGLPSQLQRVTAKFLLRSKPKLEDFPEDVKYHVFEVEKIYLYDDLNTNTGEGNSNNDGDDRIHNFAKINNGDNKDNDEKKEAQYEEEYSFVRRRTHIDPTTGRKLGSVYGQTTVRRTKRRDGGGGEGDGDEGRKQQVIEVKRILTRREFVAAYKTRDPHRHIVRQRRVSFLYRMQSFNVHMYGSPVDDLCILHAQAEGGGGDGDGAAGTSAAVELPPFLDVERRIENTKEDEERYGAFNISLKK